MSRVEDDRDQARIAARLAEQKRVEEQKKTEKVQQDNVFSKLVGKTNEEARQKQTQQTQQQNTARAAIAAALEQRELPSDEALLHEGRTLDQQREAGLKARVGTKGLEERVQQHTRSDGQAAQKTKLESDQGTQQAQSGRATDQGQSAGRTSARQADAKVGREQAAERQDATDSANAGRAEAAGGKGDKGELKTDADKGGGQQQGGGKDSKDGAGAQQNLRFNPALMAPPPVAKPKEAGGSERLRKIANELAQKIVERVRVGTNASGKVEFQIDMRSDVLSGLQVKVSSHNGKIKAVFSGANKDVLKLIEEQGEALKKALSGRGLTLEEFKVEGRS